MSGFSNPFGANSNPFGPQSSDARRAQDNSSPGFMHQVIEEDENDTITSPTSAGFGSRPAVSGPSRSIFQDASTDFSPPFGRPPPPGEYPAQYNFGRRTSVSAESLKPVADSYDNWTPPVHQKTAEQIDRLKRAIQGNFLFSHLDDEQSAQILGALVEKPIPTKGIKVAISFFFLFGLLRICTNTNTRRSSRKATRATFST